MGWLCSNIMVCILRSPEPPCIKMDVMIFTSDAPNQHNMGTAVGEFNYPNFLLVNVSTSQPTISAFLRILACSRPGRRAGGSLQA